ncbi:aromatic amino acid hydroxylase [Aneurinibacillus aneurinilyticus]|uniref:Biopterin-dependent aromatic amino acid hydroxylase n=1 Tax=Aneurinibacillus aneurinilyticus ATCC 12856 TaxID=649747 RepID=U1WDV8_ANEAE|nr:aromatic amino acid hydroxylase [Aneurinibacillus aneurinilyticus]ERI06734.1 Biopterin-dependent aromatic amino acid hydroxylase [Aneurinibacillus aneurinilyticus ATCC 12856]MED0704975.1 aromatic amino acid hydroxylase [Aneurinibacillus aneurinilyticus]MED0721578.1 aromatic amino acid hydroxylase [Aneurinibacillus aneurinilyticus]MED0733705.1 aromatic amino acid hydroxylase [Aneurinibacillus aneurinilyticus]MED0741256.1 aromatic amino acid hydroxylase [Aneurinibacillus aneurinilyticus]
MNIPSHLREFVVDQEYEKYTPINQAVWRYVMRQNRAFLGERAHAAYIDGLRSTGIDVESIPRIEAMNECLSKYGWGAVTIDGFLSSAAFMDFQAHGILPIATDIRTHEHIAYTPAPDILHEAAGHAPILKDKKYASFVKLIGALGAKAMSTKEDYNLYEAIRHLSMVKEDPMATHKQVTEAEQRLREAQEAIVEVSEIQLVSRLYWWTVEYGLIGTIDNPQIYGAGLLSSVGESKRCLKSDVKKLPFSLDACIGTGYDITDYQPQLFVCRNFDELIYAVEELEKRLACSIGGTESLMKALQSENIATAVYTSGLQVTGVITSLEYDDNNEATYMQLAGPVALATNNKELPGHGKEYHKDGFGSPIGYLKGSTTPLEEWSNEQVAAYGMEDGARVELEFESGIRVTGTIKYVQRHQGKIILIGFESCTVKTSDGKTLFEPEWGTYDMAVGARISSVFSGAADQEKFSAHTDKKSLLTKASPQWSERERKLHEMYQKVRTIRESDMGIERVERELTTIAETLDIKYPEDWLLRLEILEIATQRNIMSHIKSRLRMQLDELSRKPENKELIENGLMLLSVSDSTEQPV